MGRSMQQLDTTPYFRTLSVQHLLILSAQDDIVVKTDALPGIN